MEEYTVIVPGRICLFGDKVDLLEKPVIAAAINLLMHIKLTKRKDDIVRFRSENLDITKEFHLNDAPDFTHPLKYWSAIVERLKKKSITTGFTAEVNSQIPIGGGLSSSAALSVGLIKGLNKMYDLQMDKGQIAELAYVCEHDDLGIMCGRMDQYAIAYGGVTFIETGSIPSVERLQIDSLPLIVGNSQEERKAANILNRVKKEIQEKVPEVIQAFKEIEQVVYAGKKALLEDDFETIGKLMNTHQQQEDILRATTPKINNLCQQSIKAGAFGAKQMGAGGGGAFEAICPGKQDMVKKAIEINGGKTWVCDIYSYKDE
ncbi:MAG: GHMP family kinase ATP-binding protein [Promethearchaeota archaeon]